jgi:hypothetical protein
VKCNIFSFNYDCNSNDVVGFLETYENLCNIRRYDNSSKNRESAAQNLTKEVKVFGFQDLTLKLPCIKMKTLKTRYRQEVAKVSCWWNRGFVQTETVLVYQQDD